MKKFAILLGVMIGMFVLAVGVANADVLVNTTFEPDSAGPTTWDNEYSTRWGRQTGESYSYAVDPCSGVEWIRNATTANFGPTTILPVISGTQCGYVKGLSDSSEKYSKLEFGSGDYNGVYTVTWLQSNRSMSTVEGKRSSFVWIIDNSIISAVKVFLSEDSHAILVSYEGGTVTLMPDMVDSIWYDFEMVIDFQAKKLDIRVKEAGNSYWQSTLDDLGFIDPNCASFDRIYCEGSSSKVYGYFDDIKVTEGLPVYECGDWGYPKGDLNKDCYVDLKDLAILAGTWLDCTDPYDQSCFE